MSTIIYLLITMAFSAFFSGMEIAFVSVDKLRFEMERKPGITSSILSCFFRNPNNFISTMLVGNNIALVIYGILMAQIIEVNLLAGMIDNHFVRVLVQTIISTLVILVTGEFLPKTLFKINPNLVLRVFAIPLFVCYVILFPISKEYFRASLIMASLASAPELPNITLDIPVRTHSFWATFA